MAFSTFGGIYMKKDECQKKKRNVLDSDWFERILNKSEEVGISNTVLKRFEIYYITKRSEFDARPTTPSSRAKGSRY
jgi:hypothetical protein